MHVITRLILGGAQENTLLTVEGLDRLGGYRTTLIAGPAIGPEGGLVERAQRRGVDLILLPSLRRAISPWRDALAFRALLWTFRDERPDIVHTHSSKAGILGRLAARSAGVPVIIHSIHGPPFHAQQGRAANWLCRRAEKLVAGGTSRFISVADAMTEAFVQSGIAPREKFLTIYSGMDVAPFLAQDGGRARVRAEFGISPSEIVIGKIARLFHLKGHEDVLRAFAELAPQAPAARLLFVGDGILRQRLTALSASLGIGGKVTFAGLVAPDRIPEMIKAMDLLVHASLREGLARVLPQALLSGCPLISYDVDGAREVVRDGVTGFLVAPGSVAGLREAMQRTLANLDAARAMALKGRELFVEQFRAETMVRRVAGLYEEELARAQVDVSAAGPRRSAGR
jgi:glycosyltransferase involved in cell wall biosynthesis